MKKFILVVFIFCLPFLLFFVTEEIYCHTKTTYAIKKHYLESNLDSIEVLFLGSSHSQSAINPEFIKCKSCNIAFGAQPIPIDYYLLDKYIDKMPRLKMVFFEIAPHRFYLDLNISDWNGYFYNILYDINYKMNGFSPKSYSFVVSDFEFFTRGFLDYINPSTEKKIINKFGINTNNLSGRFNDLNCDTAKIRTSFKLEGVFSDSAKYKNNVVFFNKIIKRCKSKNIEIVFITTPFYKTYLSQIPIESKKRVDSVTRKYVTEFGIKYFDFAKDSSFTVYDFKDDNHLNSLGAKKFTLKIDSLLKK